MHEVYRPTFVYVTHDQIEAMTIGQKIVVVDKSAIQQYDVPSNIYNRPANIFVARFIGSPSMNVIDAGVDGDCLLIGDSRVKIPSEWRRLIGERREVKFGVRPENIKLSNGSGDPSTPAMSTCTPVLYKGRAYIGVSGTSQFGAYTGHNITVVDLDSMSPSRSRPYGYTSSGPAFSRCRW